MDTAPVKVVVLDRPTDPRGPLNISNVHKNGCSLDWKEPADDGGVPVSHYVIEKQDLAGSMGSLWRGTQSCQQTGRVRSFRSQKSIVAKDPFDTADRPGTPDIVDWDKDFADLKWTPPTNKKTGNGDWEYATEVPADKLDAHVDHLIPGKSYQFRVKALNKAGESAPSDPSRTLIAKARRLPPKIDRTMLNEIRIKKMPKLISISFDRTKIDNSLDNNTKLKTRLAERVDSGKYTLVATNEHGKDEADVNVIVLDVPGTPNGPLDVRDVTKDSATVKLEKQEDNGRWVPCGESTDTSLRVGRLNEGHDYKFRVKAVNKQGESKPLTADTAVVDWDKDHMDLTWKAPISDGGAPIDSYIIEKKDRFGDWTPCATVAGDQTKGTAEGEPSDPTEPKVAKPRKLAPKLNLDGLMDIRVRAGQPITLEVGFEGEPTPTVSWTINDKPFSGTEHAELVAKDHLSTISIISSVRSDMGSYSITVQNEFGIDSGKCNVTVLDVPSPPQAPLKPSNIHKEGCNLTWSPPADNGGSEILHYVVEKMDTSRGNWQEVGHFPDCNAKVTKLTPNHNYLFRVKAVNMLGESKTLDTEHEITAKNMFDVPDTPDAPEIVDWDDNRIDIAWQPPKNDGGSPIKDYIVEKREKGSTAWVEVGRTPGKSFSVTGLRKSVEYEFRIAAVNDAGPSAPSAPSASQMTKARFVKPQILTQQRKYKLRAGNTMTMEVAFVGTPDPSVNWTMQKVGSLAPELIVDVKQGLTSIFFPSAKRSESGNYQLNLKNEVGEDEGVFEIIIQDRPAPPKGPLQVDNITKDSCTLSWNPPEDDGGSALTNYVVERREVHSNAWVPVSTFVVSAENALGRSDPLVTDSSITAKDPYGTPGKPGKPIITDHDVDHIDMEWEAPRDDGGNPITHYDVERKDQKTGRWIKVNTSPVKGTKYSDDRVHAGHCYEYRIVAVNKAGPGRPSDPSDAAWAKPKFEAPRFELDIDGKEIRVRAGDPIDLGVPFVGSPNPEIKWTKEGKEMSGVQTSGNVTRLYVPQSKRSDGGQCRITASNSQGQAEARVLISVIDKPGPPEGPVTYPYTTRRSVTVSWKPPKDDGGVELTGYRLEYQEVGSTIWEKVHETTTLLSHTVKNLENKKQYKFRIFAENIVGLSEPLNGEPVFAKDPFDPPGAPSTPEVTGFDTNMVALKWNPPRDDGGSPIIGYVIERFEKRGGGDWAPVTHLGLVRTTSANVTGLSEGETYQFRVRAVNAAGEGPPSNGCEPVTCRPFVQPPDAPERPRILKVTKNSVELSWIRPAFDGGAPIDGYIVEQRRVGDGDWTRSNSKPVRDTRFTVENLPEKEQFEFRVIAPSRPILDLSGLRDITVRAGETITFTLPYTSGRLKPTVDVTNGTQSIFEDERTSIVVDDDKIVFTTTAAKRTDAGPYKVVVQNRFGKDFAKLKVNVLDVPGKPTGSVFDMRFEVSNRSPAVFHQKLANNVETLTVTGELKHKKFRLNFCTL
uniref:Titin n=1 Tax=Ditylenchus dipsaci TaxID=166011 RepID=A0A915DB94_9BILA